MAGENSKSPTLLSLLLRGRNTTMEEVVDDLFKGAYSWATVISCEEGAATTNQAELLITAPGVNAVLTATVLKERGDISPGKAALLDHLIFKLVLIVADAQRGETDALLQLEVIQKFASPDIYDVPRVVMENLADMYHTRAPLARAWELRELMASLSRVVEPMPGTENVLYGHVRINPSNVFRGSELYQLAAQYLSGKRGVTLQSLAINVYLERLRMEGLDGGIDARSLKRDLEIAKDYEQSLDEGKRRSTGVAVINGANPPIRLYTEPYSDGWKKRKKRRGVEEDKST